MKKIILSLGLAVAATLTLTNCAKESVAKLENNETFSLFAGISTKTANDSLATQWVADDQLSVFYEEVGDEETYSSNIKFSISAGNLEAKRFTTGAKFELDEQSSYNWYAIYPNNYKIPSPKGDGVNGFLTIGGVSQSQDGNNSMAHLCGTSCPLYGVASDVPFGTSPSVTMKNVTSVVEFKVVNSTSKAFKVNKIEFAAGENIVGTYFIDFTASPMSFTSSGDNYVSKTATLSVTNAENIAVGDSATFYVAIKPFSTSAAMSVKVYVEDADDKTGSFTKEITPVSAITFTAGKIKTVSLNVDKLSGEKVYTIAEVLAAGAGKAHNEAVGTFSTMAPATVVAINSSNIILKDETGIILFYKSNTGLKVGDVVNYSGAVKMYYGIIEFTGSVSIAKTGTTSVTHTPTLNLDAAAIETFATTPSVTCVSFKGENDANGIVTVKGTTKTISMKGYDTSLKNKPVLGIGYTYSYNSTSSNIGVIVTTLEEDTTIPTLSITPETKTWANESLTEQVFTVTSTNGSWNLSYDTAADTYFSIAADKGNGTISVTPKGINTSGIDYEYTLSVSHAADSTLKKTISIKQTSGSSSEFEKVTAAPADWSGTYILVYEKAEEGKPTVAYIWTGVDAASCYQVDSLKTPTIKGEDFVTLTIEKSSTKDKYLIKMNGGANSGKYISSSGNSNAVAFGMNGALMTITIKESSSFITNDGGAVMRYNNTSNQERFRYYKTTSYSAQKPVQLYKKK